MCRMVQSLVLVLAFAAQGLCADAYLNRKLKSKEVTIRSVILLPPTAYISRKGEAKERLKMILHPIELSQLPEESGEERADGLASEVGAIVSRALRQMGWQVDDNRFSIQTLQNDDKLKNLVDSLLARHEILVRNMINRPKDTEKGRYSLGQDVANLNVPAPPDAVALVYGTPNWIHKGGINPVAEMRDARTSPQWGKSGQPVNVFLHISLLDPHTGEVLCYMQIPGAVETRILEALRKIPQ